MAAGAPRPPRRCRAGRAPWRNGCRPSPAADRGNRSRRRQEALPAAHRRRRSAAPRRRPAPRRRCARCRHRPRSPRPHDLRASARRSAPRSGSGGRPARRRGALSRMAPTAPNVALDPAAGLGLEGRRQRCDEPLRRAAAQEREPGHALAIAARMRSRVIGRSRTRTPSAWNTALPIAAAVGPCAASPAPIGLLLGPADDLDLDRRHLREAQDRVALPGVAGDARCDRSGPPPSASSSWPGWRRPRSGWRRRRG